MRPPWGAAALGFSMKHPLAFSFGAWHPPALMATNTPISELVSRNLRSTRMRRKLSQEALAKALEIPHRSIC
jgi:hypothetical protein